MKRQIFIAIIWGISTASSFAVHIQGGHISYQCIDPSTGEFEIRYTEYMECDITQLINPNGTLFLDKDDDGAYEETIDLFSTFTRISATVIPVTEFIQTGYCIPSTLAICEEYIEVVYSHTVTLTGPTNIKWSSTARDGATNLDNGQNAKFEIKLRIHFAGVSNCDNSPDFDPIYITTCMGEELCVDLSGDDPDGDDIAYTLVHPIEYGGSPIDYNNGFSFSSPFGPNSTTSLNSSSGEFCFESDLPGDFLVGYKMTTSNTSNQTTAEIFRDMEINVIRCESEDLTACMDQIGPVCSGEDLIVNGSCSEGEYDHKWTVQELSDDGSATHIFSQFRDGSLETPNEAGPENLSNLMAQQGTYLEEGKCYKVILEVFSTCGPTYQHDYVTEVFCYPPEYDISIEAISCEPTTIKINFESEYPSQLSWIGPNGFNETSENIIIPNATKSQHEGLYILTVTQPCPYVEEFEVYIPEECCDVGINVDNEGCGNFSFSAHEEMVDVECFIWKLGGEVVGTDENISLDLPEGTYDICLMYLGRNRVDGSICCEEVCVIIDAGPVEACFKGDEDFCEGDQVPMDGRCSDPHDRHIWDVYEVPPSGDWNDRGPSIFSSGWNLESGPNSPNQAGEVIFTPEIFEPGKCYFIALTIQKWCDGVLVNGEIAIKRICIHPNPLCQENILVEVCEGECVNLENLVGGDRPGETKIWTDINQSTHPEECYSIPGVANMYTLRRTNDITGCSCSTEVVIVVNPIVINPCPPVIMGDLINNGPETLDLTIIEDNNCCDFILGEETWYVIDPWGIEIEIMDPTNVALAGYTLDYSFRKEVYNSETCEKCIQEYYFWPPPETATTEIAQDKMEDILIYPNPASQQLTVISTNNQRIRLVELYNADGSLVKKVQVSSKAVIVQFDVSDLAGGNYTVRVISGKSTSLFSTIIIVD